MPEDDCSVFKIPQQPDIHVTIGKGIDSLHPPGQDYTPPFRYLVSARNNSLPDSVATKINRVVLIDLCCESRAARQGLRKGYPGFQILRYRKSVRQTTRVGSDIGFNVNSQPPFRAWSLNSLAARGKICV